MNGADGTTLVTFSLPSALVARAQRNGLKLRLARRSLVVSDRVSEYAGGGRFLVAPWCAPTITPKNHAASSTVLVETGSRQPAPACPPIDDQLGCPSRGTVRKARRRPSFSFRPVLS